MIKIGEKSMTMVNSFSPDRESPLYFTKMTLLSSPSALPVFLTSESKGSSCEPSSILKPEVHEPLLTSQLLEEVIEDKADHEKIEEYLDLNIEECKQYLSPTCDAR